MTVKIGLETLLNEQRATLKNQRIGLVVGAASIDAHLNSSLTRLWQQDGVNLTALYGPEHGLRGEVQAGQHIDDAHDSVTGLPIYSLHSLENNTYQPNAAMLKNVDTILFDVQDAGLRFYTYLSTLVMIMRAAAEHSKRVVVLDRPAPLNGLTMEGGLLDPAFSSFVGISVLPMRYGMTVGEIAGFINTRDGIHCELSVIPMRGWTRARWHDETGLPFVPPSPNIPTLTTLTAYAGMCLIEGTNLSEGRGTTKPFEYIGAPYMDALAFTDALNALGLDGVRFRPVYFVPTFSKYAGILCQGTHIYITDRLAFEPAKTALHLIETAKTLYPQQYAWHEPWAEGSRPPIDLLTGSDRTRHHFDHGGTAAALLTLWQQDVQHFAAIRAPYLLYE